MDLGEGQGGDEVAALDALLQGLGNAQIVDAEGQLAAPHPLPAVSEDYLVRGGEHLDAAAQFDDSSGMDAPGTSYHPTSPNRAAQARQIAKCCFANALDIH